MAINRSGFITTSQGVEIDKDTNAQLTYTLDWSNWLDGSDTINTATFEVAARRNDPTPITVESSGIESGNQKTYVELAGGQEDKTYIVHCEVVTDNGLTDRRHFRVKVVDRSA